MNELMTVHRSLFFLNWIVPDAFPDVRERAMSNSRFSNSNDFIREIGDDDRTFDNKGLGDSLL
jgi:hypothetical protein